MKLFLITTILSVIIILSTFTIAKPLNEPLEKTLTKPLEKLKDVSILCSYNIANYFL